MHPVVAFVVGLLCLGSLFGLPYLLFHTLLRRIARANTPVADDGAVLVCARCESPDIRRLVASRISPFPGYECDECDLRMRAVGTGLLYAGVILLGVPLFALGTAPVWADLDARGPAGFALTAAVGVGYSVWQLTRPTPRRVYDPDRSPVGPAGS